MENKFHLDYGSHFTMVLMLSDTKDFSGGVFKTWEADGSWAMHELEKGDCIVIPSHKYHSVGEVTGGTRVVCVMEVWDGCERTEYGRGGANRPS